MAQGRILAHLFVSDVPFHFVVDQFLVLELIVDLSINIFNLAVLKEIVVNMVILHLFYHVFFAFSDNHICLAGVILQLHHLVRHQPSLVGPLLNLLLDHLLLNLFQDVLLLGYRQVLGIEFMFVTIQENSQVAEGSPRARSDNFIGVLF